MKTITLKAETNYIFRDVKLPSTIINADIFSGQGSICITQLETVVNAYHCSYMEKHPIVFSRVFTFISFCKYYGISFIDVYVK